MQQSSHNSLVYYRLIALWVLCEAMLGGIIHGFKLPVSGLVVGSCAVICICLIAWYVPKKGSIIRATVIVAIFKMMLSPQAPPPAYIAVFFQGVLGELIFWNRRYFGFSCILVAVLSLLESGFQRILVLTIVYGNDLWKVINNFINGLTRQKTVTNYSLWIVGGYVFLHFITGLLVGWWASILPKKVEQWREKKQFAIAIDYTGSVELPKHSSRRKRVKKGLFVVWIILVALYVQSYFKIGTPLLPSHISLKILLRSLIIVMAWVFIVGPVLRQLLHGWLQKKKTEKQPEIQQVLALLPATQELITRSWKASSVNKGWKRIEVAVKMVLVNALAPVKEVSPAVFILTGPVQTGKTSSLVQWVAGRNDVSGILTPVVEGRRLFMDIRSGERFQMEATEEEDEKLSVGRFVFSKVGFDKAVNCIRQAILFQGWLVIDEIGPLELRGEGFSEILKEVLAKRRDKILLVVRDKDDMVEKLTQAFHINNVMVVKVLDELTP